MTAKKTCTALGLIAVCVFASSFVRLAAEPVSTTATVLMGEVSINLSYSTEEGILKIGYSKGDKECQLVFSSTQRMGLLIQVTDTKITFSLKFLEEAETWSQTGALGKEYTLKRRFETSGWVVVVVQRSEQRGETG